ncbi:helix-turn-helix domain-containing protein [Micromonospora zingiberis]|uniref:helix-turn-helix domain-containing protein n=1 Tax=Micromonospora zingiberis TaxID=2053011 RepID=UPI00197D6560|nr:XRE family transcriptional regulator [Micromonospora zingiberis]
MGESDASAEWVRVGERIRVAREAAKLSVRELARRVEVSSSHVSQVERGLASFSVRALYNVVSVLGISMDSLFEDVPSVAGSPAASTAADPAPPTPDGPLDDGGIVLRRAARPTIALTGGTRWERLTPKPEVNAEFIEVVYPPNPQAVPPPKDYIRHSSREYGIVVQGSLTVQVGFDQTVLHAGDSIAFDSHIPHRFWNATAEEVRAIWFIRDDPRGGGESNHAHD